MGVDSGLPDFRGPEGFWRAYPPYRELGPAVRGAGRPRPLRRRPALAWGFYGHRLALYRRRCRTPGSPCSAAGRGAADLGVFTSNVDGQFQARQASTPDASPRCHGSIHRLQCPAGCGAPVWSADDVTSRSTRRRCGADRRCRVPAVRRAGPAEHPDVRRRRLDRRTEAAPRLTAYTSVRAGAPDVAGRGRDRCGHGHPDGPAPGRAGLRGDRGAGPDQRPGPQVRDGRAVGIPARPVGPDGTRRLLR